MYTFKKLSQNGNELKTFKLKESDTTTTKLSMLFEVQKNDLFLTDDDSTVIWPNDDGSFSNLYNYNEYYVNGQSLNGSKLTPLSRTLNTAGLPAPINRLTQGK